MRFGDKDPLDVWDESDPLERKIEILERVVDYLRGLDRVPNGERDEALRLVLGLRRARAGILARIEQIQTALEEL
jgi:hypothetical protein